MQNHNQIPIGIPLDVPFLLRNQKRIRRRLREQNDGPEVRIAILGGSTTGVVTDFIDLFLLADGFRPKLWESDYNRFFEDGVFGNTVLDEFSPDFVFVHTSTANILEFPGPFETEAEVEVKLCSTYQRFETLWTSLAARYSCCIIQNNFELPYLRPLSQLDATSPSGRTVFVNKLNDRLAQFATKHASFHVNDINYLSSWIGLEKWYDRRLYHSYKCAMSLDAIPPLAQGVASIIRASLGHSKKCLVIDLDNTIWGGIIGDDGVDGIQLGNDTATGEAFLELQQYIKDLHSRGVILAVCSKNDDEMARAGLEHRDSLLTQEKFTTIKANWLEKSENVKAVAMEINIGIDSLVFLDDNQFEREVVSSQVPDVSVPDLGDDMVNFAKVLDKSGYFEAISLSHEDRDRQRFYSEDLRREGQKEQFTDYAAFLASLDMIAEVGPLVPAHMARITQLTNKTNQFNLTTRRYNQAELEAFRTRDDYITLCGRLKDRFGDNGLVTLIIGSLKGDTLEINQWLMSCRVIRRDLEYAMLTELEQCAKSQGVRTLRGYFIPSKRNGVVKDHYQRLGFELVSSGEDGSTVWSLDITARRKQREYHIKIVQHSETSNT